jgi:uncharacterized protein
MIKELVTFVVQQLVSHPHEVVISVTEKEDIDLLEIKVSPDDRGRVIGKEGHTIKSLRALVDVAGAHHGKKVSIELSR